MFEGSNPTTGIQRNKMAKKYLSYLASSGITVGNAMEQRPFKNVNNYLNTNIYSHLETSGGQSSNMYLNVVHLFKTRVNLTYVAA